MYANIVLAGGGVKGAVLAGCLKAAEDKGVQIVGIGGTSAGSIVAALAAVGYSGKELEELLVKTDFNDLLDDGGDELRKLIASTTKLSKRLRNKEWLTLFALKEVADYFKSRYGLYTGTKLKKFLADAIKVKIGGFRVPAEELTFQHLSELKMRPLRIVATDLNQKHAAIFGTGTDGANQRIVDAVLASASFPFAFKPVELDGRVLSDGGLSSNLPTFLFEQEYRKTRTPTLAFDLISPAISEPLRNETINLGAFAKSLLSSALEASDVLLRNATPGVAYFAIETPEGIETLDFSLSKAQREACFTKGYSQAATKLESYEPLQRTRQFSGELQKSIMSQFGAPRLYEPILRALIDQIDVISPGKILGARAHIMLLTGRSAEQASSTRIVTYALGMDSDPDRDLELNQDGGCSGKAWESGQVAVADLESASTNPALWKMTPEQHNKVPRRIKSMMSVPIPGNVHDSTSPTRPIGTLSIDCETPLANTGWCTDGHGPVGMDPSQPVEVSPEVLTIMRAWATIVGAMLP